MTSVKIIILCSSVVPIVVSMKTNELQQQQYSFSLTALSHVHQFSLMKRRQQIASIEKKVVVDKHKHDGYLDRINDKVLMDTISTYQVKTNCSEVILNSNYFVCNAYTMHDDQDISVGKAQYM